MKCSVEICSHALIYVTSFIKTGSAIRKLIRGLLIQARAHTHTQTHRHTETQTHRHTETQRHRDTETQRHEDELINLLSIIQNKQSSLKITIKVDTNFLK
jgi:hypothetical protein